jgi:hypothetical protein
VGLDEGLTQPIGKFWCQITYCMHLKCCFKKNVNQCAKFCYPGLHQGNCNKEKCENGNCHPLSPCNRFDYWVWLGLNDNSEEGSFVWSDGTINQFTAWDTSVKPRKSRFLNLLTEFFFHFHSCTSKIFSGVEQN